MTTARPHVVIFNPDSYRGDVLEHLGNRGAVTRNLDAIVDTDAISYRNAFAQNPVCTPSRCSFMTGQYPHVHGHRSMRNLLKPYEKNLLSVLRAEGYFTWWGGKNDLCAITDEVGYDTYCDLKYQPDPSMDGVVFPQASERWMSGAFYEGVIDISQCNTPPVDRDGACVNGAIELIANDPLDKPLFIYLPLSNPHPAYRVEDIYLEDIDVNKIPDRIKAPEDLSRLPPIVEALQNCLGTKDITDEQWRKVKRIYYGMCAKIDVYFGKLTNALKERGIYDDTLIIFLSDHGDFAGDYSLPEKSHHSFQDGLLKVPFIIKPHKGIRAAPGTREQLVELVDMTATIYDLLDINPGYDCQGQSLRRSIAGDDSPMREAVFAEAGSRKEDVAFSNNQVLSMDPESFYFRQSRSNHSLIRAGSYGVMCRTQTHKCVRRGYSDRHELYDLTEDPGEINNLYDADKETGIQREMETMLLDYFMKTGDTLPYERDRRG